MGLRSGKYWLCVAPLILCALDTGLTLHGQSVEYWDGHYSLFAAEEEPLGLWCLKLHPAAFLVENVLWAALFVTLIVVTPWRVARVISLGVAIGHVLGSCSWLWDEFKQHWLFTPALLGFAWLIVWCWERAEAQRNLNRSAQPTATTDRLCG